MRLLCTCCRLRPTKSAPFLARPEHQLNMHTQSRRLKLIYIYVSALFHSMAFPSSRTAALVVVSKVVAQALGLALAIGMAVGVGVQVFGPAVLVQLAGEKSKEVSTPVFELP